MQDVEESVALMISLSNRAASEVADLLFKAIHALANRNIGEGESKPGLIESAREALERKIPGIGAHGEVTAATLHKGGAEVSVAMIESEDLSRLKAELGKEGVDFAVVRNADATASVLFRAKDFDLMQNALAQVGSNLGISEEDLAFAAMAPEQDAASQEQGVAEPEQDAASQTQSQEQSPEQKAEAQRQGVAKQAGTRLGVTWTAATATAEPALEAQVSECDLTAHTDGTWSVSIAGSEVGAGRSAVPDLTGAMIDATASAKATISGHDLLQGVTWPQGLAPSPAAGDGHALKAAQQEPGRTVASVAQQARAKAQIAAQGQKPSLDAPKPKRQAPRR